MGEYFGCLFLATVRNVKNFLAKHGQTKMFPNMVNIYRIASNKRPGDYLFRAPFRPGAYSNRRLFISFAILTFLFTTLTGTFIYDTTENVSSIKKRIM